MELYPAWRSLPKLSSVRSGQKWIPRSPGVVCGDLPVVSQPGTRACSDGNFELAVAPWVLGSRAFVVFRFHSTWFSYSMEITLACSCMKFLSAVAPSWVFPASVFFIVKLGRGRMDGVTPTVTRWRHTRDFPARVTPRHIHFQTKPRLVTQIPTGQGQQVQCLNMEDLQDFSPRSVAK